MNHAAALIGTSLLLAIIIVATVLSATFYVPHQGNIPIRSVSTIVVPPSSPTASQSISNGNSTASTTTQNQTQLVVTLSMPNGSSFDNGALFAGTQSENSSHGQYLFPKIIPGTYALSLKSAGSVYLPPTSVQLRTGLNNVSVFVYPLRKFALYFSNGLSVNGTQPGPTIAIPNATAVELYIFNNTTLIHNLGIVQSLANESSSNVLFGSLSVTLNAGGSANDTFVATSPGLYYYEDLIGNHGHDGDYGNFFVLA